LVSAIRDLKRQGKLAQAAALKTTLAKIEKRIQRSFELLTSPKYLHDEHGSQSRGFDCPHLPEEMDRYYFLNDRAIAPNRYHFLGFCCPQCNARVTRLKQPIDIGQGWRMRAFSCHCHTLAIACPPVRKHSIRNDISGIDDLRTQALRVITLSDSPVFIIPRDSIVIGRVDSA
jgi:hypothetical protein